MADSKPLNLGSLQTLGALPMSGDADAVGLCVGDVCVVDDTAFAKAEAAVRDMKSKSQVGADAAHGRTKDAR